MIITYHGGQCFKVVFGDTTLAFDPISKHAKKLEPVKFGADVAMISLRHPTMNGAAQVAFGTKEPFVIDGPGEYELGDVSVRGYGVRTHYDGEDRYGTIYQVRMEEMNLIFLGPLKSPDIDPKILSELGDIDILFVPIGGGDVLEVPEAAKLATKLEAHLIIPMHYEAAALKAFLKEVGSEGVSPLDKLTIKKKDVQAMESEVVVLRV